MSKAVILKGPQADSKSYVTVLPESMEVRVTSSYRTSYIADRDHPMTGTAKEGKRPLYHTTKSYATLYISR